MPYLLDIATANPVHSISNSEVINFYSRYLLSKGANSIQQKLPLIIENSQIKNRYSCIPDFNSSTHELFKNENAEPSVDDRMEVYKREIVPLSVKAIDQLFEKTGVPVKDITHLITVSCTGFLAPGLEFLVAGHYGMHRAEKLAINYLGCYAAIKAMKHAHYIATADPKANILVVCSELCSLHFNSSCNMEDVIANLLFSDGAAAFIMSGNRSPYIRNRTVLQVDGTGSATIPDTNDLMTWSITSSAFRMFLSRKIIGAIRDNIHEACNKFLGNNSGKITSWAIHPGGIRIIKAVMDGLHLNEEQVSESLDVLRNYGNMSSPAILFILKEILDKIRSGADPESKQVFACAFGPGLNIEMIHLSPVTNAPLNTFQFHSHAHVAHSEIE